MSLFVPFYFDHYHVYYFVCTRLSSVLHCLVRMVAGTENLRFVFVSFLIIVTSCKIMARDYNV